MLQLMIGSRPRGEKAASDRVLVKAHADVSANPEKANLPPMNVFRIYEALTSPTPPEHLRRAGPPFAVVTALSLLAEVDSVPLIALEYSATELEMRLPPDSVPIRAQTIFKTELSRYRAWRRTIFDVYLLDHGKPADRDPIAALMRIGRVKFGTNTYQHLYMLRRALPELSDIHGLSHAKALKIDKRLDPEMRQNYRAALGMLDQLRSAPLAASSLHLLPKEEIGRLPPPSGHIYHAPLPPQLQSAYENAGPTLTAALPFVYRLSLEAGLVEADQDVSFDEFVKKSALLGDADPADYGFSKPSRTSLKIYLRSIERCADQLHTA